MERTREQEAVRRRNVRIAALLIATSALPAIAFGCSSPSEPVPPPGGGSVANLDYAQFASTIDPILTRHGCDQGGDCHGGGIRGALELSPADAKDPQFDFDQVKWQVSVSDPERSPILTEPLALDAGGTAHGYKTFMSTSDSDYVRLRDWVVGGVSQ